MSGQERDDDLRDRTACEHDIEPRSLRCRRCFRSLQEIQGEEVLG